METKYNYLKVIQQNYGQGWEDVSEYETNSQGEPKEFHEYPVIDGKHRQTISLVRYDLAEYKLTGYPTRVIGRKELKEIEL